MKYKKKLPDHLRPSKSKKHKSVKSGRKKIKLSDYIKLKLGLS